jgi:hypothetical protein
MRRIVSLLMVAALVGAPASASASSARPGRAVFAHGTSPAGERWSAVGRVTPNRRRHFWRSDFEFNFSSGFSSGGGQEIPVGTHQDLAGQADGYTGLLARGAPESAAFGRTGPEVETVKMKMSDGTWLEVHPVFPPRRLRQKFVWMRGFRYFMQFYRGGAYVTEYWLYDDAGKQVGCNNYADGELYSSICGSRPVE